MCVCMLFACEGHVHPQVLLPRSHSPHFWRENLSVKHEGCWKARPVGHKTLGIFLFLPPQHWDRKHKHTPSFGIYFSMWVLETELRASCLCGKHLYQLGSLPSPSQYAKDANLWVIFVIPILLCFLHLSYHCLTCYNFFHVYPLLPQLQCTLHNKLLFCSQYITLALLTDNRIWTICWVNKSTHMTVRTFCPSWLLFPLYEKRNRGSEKFNCFLRSFLKLRRGLLL